MEVVEEFKKFALRGNLIDVAVGFTVGAAFTTVAKSLVADILMPPIGLILGRADFSDLFFVLAEGEKVAAPYATLADAQAAGAVTLNIGVFLNNSIALLIVAIAMFFVIRAVNRFDKALDEKLGRTQPTKVANKKCPLCFSTIDQRATRCPQCTAELGLSSTETDPTKA